MPATNEPSWSPEPAVQFIVEERRAWVRTRSHTIVFDRDAEYERFASDPSGDIRSLLRVWWTVEGRVREYLGSLRLCDKGRRTDLMRMFRRADRLARRAGLSPHELRLQLEAFLRRECLRKRGA